MRVGHPPQLATSRKASARVATPHHTSAPSLCFPSPPALIDNIPDIPEHGTPQTKAPNQAPRIHAICLDNNGVRLQVTMHYLRRSGVSAEAVALEGDDLWRVSGKITAQCQVSGGGVKERAHVAFVELFPGGGVWDSASNLSLPMATGGEVGALKWSLEYLKTLCANARAADARMCENSAVVPLVLLSNDADPKLGSMAKSAGFAGVITKPLRCASVVASLREVLDASKQNRIQAAPNSQTQDLNLLKGTRAMVVDDNAVNRKIASKLLEKHGVSVTCKTGGEEAVEALKGDHSFDIIFMDIQMPGMDGHQATRAIRELETTGMSSGPFIKLNRMRCPILALTANAIKGSWEECKESGMDGFITKPIEERRLLQVASEFLLPVTPEEQSH